MPSFSCIKGNKREQYEKTASSLVVGLYKQQIS